MLLMSVEDSRRHVAKEYVPVMARTAVTDVARSLFISKKAAEVIFN
jgi:hypothetical protein